MAKFNTSSMQNIWQSLALRERLMLAAVLLAVGLLLLWLLLRPAVHTWQTAPAAQAQLEQQMGQLQGLAEQAQQLKDAPSLAFDAAYQALNSSVRNYLPSSSQVQLLGDEVTVSLSDVPAHSLAQWLAAARNNAKAVPISMQLEAVQADTSGARWSGKVRLRLPPRE